MAVANSSCFLDTNILLRLAKRDSPEFGSIREALRLLDRGDSRNEGAVPLHPSQVESHP